MNRYEFEVLRCLAESRAGIADVRSLSDEACLSAAAVLKSLTALKGNGWTEESGEGFRVTEAGLAALEPYRVKRAVVVAAGFGSRLMPATADRPKPMVRVKGVRLIDTLLDALVAVGITDITVVGGYRIEKLRELLEKYPFLQILENTKYTEENNISSALLARDAFHGGCYFCEADLYISNPAVIRKYQYVSNILGSWSLETDDWCFQMVDGALADYKKGGTYCYNYYGISYWTAEDCEKLKTDWAELHDAPGGKELFWEFPPFILRKEKYRVEVRTCRKQDIMEIDNYRELVQLDPSYGGDRI